MLRNLVGSRKSFKTLMGRRNKLSAYMNMNVSVMSTKADSFMSGSNSIYVEQMYDSWRRDPSSVHGSWQSYFSNLDAGVHPAEAFASLPNINGGITPSVSVATSGGVPMKSDSLGLSYLISAYQVRGHELANLDPLDIHAYRESGPEGPAELDYTYHGFTEADLDRKLNLLGNSSGGHTGFLDILGSRPNITLREVISNLQKTYCSNIGVEYMHMGSREKCNWIRTKVEHPSFLDFTKGKKMHIYERLAFASQFEAFCGNKFNTAKRFGLEGGEACIPGLKCLVDRGSELGIESFTFGMPHRGRLNVLANVMRKPMPQIFKEFQGTHYDLDEYLEDDYSSSGDVKYHLGTSMDRTYPDGRRVHLSLVANPSHLEAVNPVVVGKVRAKQFLAGNRDEDKLKHLPILLHGDAAFAGQGIVYETIQMSRVPEYAVGGTIHVIVNNQVGFTTDPHNGRSTMYSSDLGKAFNIPIFHCNGDDPLAVCSAFEMAVEWRQQFKEDCIIDMICYRKFGHNELDQPMYTQPIMYHKIAKMKNSQAIFEDRLVAEGTCEKAELDTIRSEVNKTLEQEFVAAKDWTVKQSDWLSSKWEGFLSNKQLSRIRETGIEVDKLREIGLKISTIPDEIQVHKQLKKIFQLRKKTIEEGKGIDWGTAEALAFGSLLLEGNHVRISGQDVQRGTFSHRHAVVKDQNTGIDYIPLNNLEKHVSASVPIHSHDSFRMEPNVQAQFLACNSILSEFGVLGFELGYSLENPNTLILWEAQFGDFVNGAQIMIDQFITAGEDKWLRQSGLTMLLPHGYMGQGAEHSSCRLERFLQQVEEDPDVIPAMAENERMQIQHSNLQVLNCSTPANYFHALRRQVHRDFRKPLVIATPKNLLREKKCVSTLEEMGEHTKFKRVYEETSHGIRSKPEDVRKIIFCSGKIYYELVDERNKRGLTDVAICRIEQIAPFPWDRVAEECAHFKNAEIVWAQEEPKNMGAWSFVQPRFHTACKSLNGVDKYASYAGRKPSAATATGLGGRAHEAEQQAIIDEAFA